MNSEKQYLAYNEDSIFSRLVKITFSTSIEFWSQCFLSNLSNK